MKTNSYKTSLKVTIATTNHTKIKKDKNKQNKQYIFVAVNKNQYKLDRPCKNAQQTRLPFPLDSTQQYIQGSLNKFPVFFRMGTFIDSTHMKL